MKLLHTYFVFNYKSDPLALKHLLHHIITTYWIKMLCVPARLNLTPNRCSSTGTYWPHYRERRKLLRSEECNSHAKVASLDEPWGCVWCRSYSLFKTSRGGRKQVTWSFQHWHVWVALKSNWVTFNEHGLDKTACRAPPVSLFSQAGRCMLRAFSLRMCLTGWGRHSSQHLGVSPHLPFHITITNFILVKD